MAEALTQIPGAPTFSEINPGAASGEIIVRPIPEGLRTWLPAIVVLLGMPLLALLVTQYGLVPPMKRAAATSEALAARAAAGENTGPVYYTQLPLNGQAGFRSVALVSNDEGIKLKIAQNKSKLIALASREFRDTTVSDLDNADALTAKRAQLRADFNQALGEPVVQEVYIAEWPTQKP